jgi:uncharacterized membrane protein
MKGVVSGVSLSYNVRILKEQPLVRNTVAMLGLGCVGLGMSALQWTVLPDPMPMHWNLQGQVDGWASKWVGAFAVPTLMVFLPSLVWILRRVGFRKENIEASSEGISAILLSIVVFLLVLHAMCLRASVSVGQSLHPGSVGIAVGVLFVALGRALPSLQFNFFAGIRTPWTLTSDVVWKQTHQFGGACFVLGGMVAVVNAVLWPHKFWISFVVLFWTCITPFFYSYVAFRKENRDE